MHRHFFAACIASAVLCLPPAVLAQASWYGSIRAGIADEGGTSVSDNDSRWGIRGSSEVAEGLTAVYRFEHGIDATNAAQDTGRLSYVGLSGGFGTITIGQVWSATSNSFGAITDRSFIYGSRITETSQRHGNAVSYAISVGSVSLQVDAILDSSASKTVDAYEFGVTIDGLMDSGSVAIAHKRFADFGDVKRTTNYIAGEYVVGTTRFYLGASRRTGKQAGCTSSYVGLCADKATNDVTYAGFGGVVGDTGVSYLVQIRNNHVKLSQGYLLGVRTPADSAKNQPWIIGLSRRLGGGASVHFEHWNRDSTRPSATGIWLKVDF